MVVELSDLHIALEKYQLVPCFQPLVDLRSGKLTGFEVLARWQHPTLGLILPKNFISLAEGNGLIGELTQQVFRKAFLSAPILPAPLTLSLNISPVQMRYVSLAAQIREAAESTGFALDRVTIEITESALIDNLQCAQTIAGQLKDMGCRLALDDFGTGYSSLAHLQALRFDELKVDRSFIRSVTAVRESRKIVAAIIGLGHSLGLITVAEGVETEDQADMLLCLGCELGQGWLYGRPVPFAELPTLVAAPDRAQPGILLSPGDGWAVSSLEALPTQRLAQLQAIYDGAPVGLCFMDRNFRYVSVNQKFAEMNNCSVESHIGKTVMEKYPAAFPLYEPYLLHALQGEAMEGIEITRPSPLPQDVDQTLLASYQPAWDEADEVIGISLAIVDISEKKRTEEALRESEDQRDHLAELTHQVPWIMDAGGNSLEASSRWVAMPGAHRSRTRNLQWLEALHADDLGPAMRKMKAALLSGEPIDLEYRVRIDGQWKWMRSRGTARRGATGEIIRWYGTVEDIDECKTGTTAPMITAAE
jgi:PAS domain S-box-containing protein